MRTLLACLAILHTVFHLFCIQFCNRSPLACPPRRSPAAPFSLEFWWLALALVIAGIGIAPVLAVMFAIVSASVKFSDTAEAYGWLGRYCDAACAGEDPGAGGVEGLGAGGTGGVRRGDAGAVPAEGLREGGACDVAAVAVAGFGDFDMGFGEFVEES